MKTPAEIHSAANNRSVSTLLKNWFNILPERFTWPFYLGCGTSVVLVLFLGIASFITLNTEQRTQQLVRHTYQVLRKVDSIDLLINKIALLKQSMPDRADNSPQYIRDSTKLFEQLTTLKGFTKDNPTQQQQIDRLTGQIRSILNAEKSMAVKAYGVSDPDRASVYVQVSNTIAAMTVTENALLSKREKGYVASLKTQKIIDVVGTTLVLTIVAFLIYMIIKELHNRYDAYQREHELNMLKSSFVTLASHEFRTPLSAILLSSSLIEKYTDKESNPAIIKHALKIRGIINNLTAILDDFLSLEKLDNGKIIPHFKTFDLADLCQEITEQLKEVNPERELSYQHLGDCREVVLDQNLIRNAIINLLTNAIKYAGQDAKIWLVSEVCKERIRIMIKDNGVGVPEKYQDKLFTLFFRVDESGSIPGTGLGLNIVMRYVHLMKGSISFISEPYHETRFEMSFPVHEQ